MLNSKAFKKLAALTAAVALVGSFAVSASAAVTTKTTYADEGIEVEVRVTGYENGTHVTYYAEKAGTPYHVDQATVENGTATFDLFVTDAENLDANVLVNGIEDKITGRKISVVKGSANVTVIPTEEDEKLVVVTPDLTEGYVYDGIEVEGAEAVATPGNDGTYNVTLSNFTADVVITVKEKVAPVDPTPVLKYIGAGYIKDGEGVKITVIGQVKDLADDSEFGAKIAGTAFKSLVEAPTDGYYAIQVELDEAEESYTTAVYADGCEDLVGDTLSVQ